MEQSALLSRLTPLLEPSELQRMALQQPRLQLRGTTAVLERQRALKRCRHLLDAWRSQRLETLEQCIATLLLESRDNVTDAPIEDMEARIDRMFAELNGDALRFQELYYNERRHIHHLDQQRCASLEETLQPLPAAPGGLP